MMNTADAIETPPTVREFLVAEFRTLAIDKGVLWLRERMADHGAQNTSNLSNAALLAILERG